MKTKSAALVLSVLLATFLSIGVFADMGPKPHINVRFEGTDGLYYCTLLYETDISREELDADLENERVRESWNETPQNVWDAFLAFEQTQNGVFLMPSDICEIKNGQASFFINFRNGPLQSTGDFYICVYGYATGIMYMSEKCERYALDSNYVYNPISNTVVRDESNTAEIVSFFIRVVLTVILELCIARLMKIKETKATVVIVVTNIITQVVLNSLLSVSALILGKVLGALLVLPLLEVLVFIIEGIVYSLSLLNGQKNGSYFWLYSLFANLCSFFAGLILFFLIPAIF